MEMADIVLDAAQRGSIAEPYFLSWDLFWGKSPPEFDTWWSIRYYGGMLLDPQYPILNYFVDYGDPWQRIGIEIDGNSYHDQGKAACEQYRPPGYSEAYADGGRVRVQ